VGREHITQDDIEAFAEARVNLPYDKAQEFRAQARRLRERLEGYLSDHPDFTLRKMLLSGSLAKRTALASLNDIDVACYISGSDALQDTQRLLDYLAERLRKAFPNFTADQVQPQTYSVTVSFRGSGLDVDIVPILYNGDSDWYGNLISQDDGSFLETCIPRHLEFAKKRRDASTDFAQVVRLAKYWSQRQKQSGAVPRFKSFMIELIFAKLSDQGMNFADYAEALQGFFTYIVRTGLREPIVFSDYYAPSAVPASSLPVQIIDPVNANNNVARLYTESDVDAIVEAAMNAGDAIDAALRALTKSETIRYWQKVFGTTFPG
jgi:hypothetical protein